MPEEVHLDDFGRLAGARTGRRVEIEGLVGRETGLSLSPWRTALARARVLDRSPLYAFLGDSLTESFSPTKRGRRWHNYLQQRLNGAKAAFTDWVPASAGTLNTTAANTWPGGQAGWTYTGTPSAAITYGPDLHGISLASGGTATISWAGDFITVYYAVTPTGPAAAAVTLDGASVDAIDAEGTEAPGTSTTYGTAGDFGWHTLVITATGAPLTLEGAVVYGGTRFGLGVPFDTVLGYCFGHSGFSTADFLSRPNWLTSFTRIAGSAQVIGIGLGPNDRLAGRSPGAYAANLRTILGQIDAAIDAVPVTADPCFLLVHLPTSDPAYLPAMRDLSESYGGGVRVRVLDLAGQVPDSEAGWGLLDNSGHPSDAGQLWIADRIAEVLDPSTTTRPQMREGGPIIEARDEPDRRSNWTASFGFTNGQGYDVTTADNAVRERRHWRWLEAGTYVAVVRYEQLTTTGGTVEVLVDGSSAGTQATTGTTGTIGETQLGSTITVDSPHWAIVTIRKTTASSAALRFMRLHLRKTG